MLRRKLAKAAALIVCIALRSDRNSSSSFLVCENFQILLSSSLISAEGLPETNPWRECEAPEVTSGKPPPIAYVVSIFAKSEFLQATGLANRDTFAVCDLVPS